MQSAIANPSDKGDTPAADADAADTLTVLTHSTCRLTKTWAADGSIRPYDDAKFFTLRTQTVHSIADAAAVLRLLGPRQHSCVIRGRYVGDALARERDPEFKPGRVRKTLDVFDDQPLHLFCADVDGFVPLAADPVLEPAAAVSEWVLTMLPRAFHGAGYFWRLSASSGHPSKAGELRAHVWFWLDRALTSAQAKAWAAALKLPIDLAVMQPVQPHYTADPVFEDGVSDPVRERSGYVDGLTGDEVVTGLDDAALAALAVEPYTSGGRFAKVKAATAGDPIAQRLQEKGLVRQQRRDGAFDITCPFAEEHTGAGGPSSTVYFPPHTGGHATGNFRCMHAHCAGRTRGMFLARLGIDEAADEFDDISGGDDAEGSTDPLGAPGITGRSLDPVHHGSVVHDSGPAAAAGGSGSPGEPDEPPRVAIPSRRMPKARHLTTDQANAGRIIASYGKRLFVSAGLWYSWDGRRWLADDGDVYRYACKLSHLIHAEADQMAAQPVSSDEERKARDGIVEGLRAWAKKSEMKGVIEAALQLARKMLAVPTGALDRDPWALNCLNGTVDLRTGALRPHDPADYITKLVPLEYSPEAQCPTFEAVLSRVMMEEGRVTQPLCSFLQRLYGYGATGSVREQVLAVHHGQGSNGKSTILDTVTAALGDYAATAAPGLLVGSRMGDRHPTEIADLLGRRTVIAHESGEGGVLREDFVKQATGGDKLKGRHMREDFFEFAPTHKLHLLTNHKPVIKGQDYGIWRRILLVPYWARFGSPEEVAAGRAQFVKDTRLAARLAAELPGVLAWVVRGAVAWFTDGLQPPDAVLAASKDYQSEQDRIGQFVRECCEMDREMSDALTNGIGGLYPAYCQWAKESGFMQLAKNRFLSELERIVPFFATKEVYTREGGGRKRKILRVQGIRLLEDL